MKPILIMALLAMVLSACGVSRNSGAPAAGASQAKSGQSASLTEDEKHQLYTAALVASDSQLNTELFQAACKAIGIMNADGIPNENYTRFVSEERLQWMRKPEAEAFKRTVNTQEKAQAYLKAHLPR